MGPDQKGRKCWKLPFLRFMTEHYEGELCSRRQSPMLALDRHSESEFRFSRPQRELSHKAMMRGGNVDCLEDHKISNCIFNASPC
jgi:hypothetical protein